MHNKNSSTTVDDIEIYPAKTSTFKRATLRSAARVFTRPPQHYGAYAHRQTEKVVKHLGGPVSRRRDWGTVRSILSLQSRRVLVHWYLKSKHLSSVCLLGLCSLGSSSSNTTCRELRWMRATQNVCNLW